MVSISLCHRRTTKQSLFSIEISTTFASSTNKMRRGKNKRSNIRLWHVAITLVGVFTAKVIEAAPFYQRFLMNHRYKHMIEGSMDTQADPCDDFYQFACGKWEEYHKEARYGRNDMLSMTDYEVNRELAKYMDSIKLRGKPKFVQLAHQFYKSCTNVRLFDHFGYLDYMKLHENLRLPKLWTGHSSRPHFDWVHSLAVMRRYGLNGIFIEEIMIHRRDDSSKTIIDLDKPVEGGGFQSMSYENLQDLIKYLDLPGNEQSFDKLWEAIREFETRLEELQEIEDDEGTRLITVKDLPLPWLSRYLATVLDYTTLDPDREVYIQNVEYMRELYELLKKYDNHFISRYLEVRFLWHLQQHGPRKFDSIECVHSTRTLLPLAMHWIYKHQHSEIDEYSLEIQQMFDNIVGYFNRTLRANNMHFNDTVLDYLCGKLSNLRLKVGNLPNENTEDVLEAFYENLSLNQTDYYGNHLKILEFSFKSAHSSHPYTLTKDVSKFFNLEIYGEGSSCSPYYLTRPNIVIVPFTSLRVPLFHPAYDEIYKYSSFGNTLAHEIFHGFDRMGLQVDYRGKMNAWQYNTVLSNPDFDANFNCLQELHPDVVDEKIADISGLYYAYGTFFNRYPNALTDTRRLNGIDMSAKKVFFLNFAQLFCDPNISDLEHGEVSDRINDALSHFSEFSRAYRCSRQSRMLPEESCQVWR
uniref:Peptidase M13 N-terminal domain-containing protein n=1 Tax=Stomoxys calcitrans TaxID=35570 RepID=A0A1I8Q1Q7_STOCA